MKREQLTELLYEALETEMGGVQVYETALRCVVNEDLKEEWENYLEQTQNHVQIVRGVRRPRPRDGRLYGTLASRSSRRWRWP